MMTKIMVENYKPDDYIIVFANTGKEREETLQFVEDCSQYWGIGIHWVEYEPQNGYKTTDFKNASRKGEPFAQLIEKKCYPPNPVARFCTAELKVRPIKKFLMDLGFTHWDSAIGVRYDEPMRVHKMKASQSRDRWDYIFPLYDMKITEKDVYNFWNRQPFDLQLMSYQGNCDLCFLKGRKKLVQVIRENPSAVDWWIEQEEKTNATFRKDWPFSDLKSVAIQQPLLFEDITDPAIACFCGD